MSESNSILTARCLARMSQLNAAEQLADIRRAELQQAERSVHHLQQVLAGELETQPALTWPAIDWHNAHKKGFE